MRKSFMSLVVVCALASVAMAVATGPGGTFYFGGGAATSSDGKAYLYYMNVNSDWDPVDMSGTVITANACGLLESLAINNNYGGTYTAKGSPEIWWNAAGNRDMGGSYQNATVLMCDRYTTTQEEFQTREPGGAGSTFTTLYGGGADTNGKIRWHLAVDSSFTPLGEAKGIAIGDESATDSAVFVDSGGGTYDADTGYTLGGVTGLAGADYSWTTGQVVSLYGATGFQIVTKTGPSTYSTVTMAGGASAHGLEGAGGNGTAAMAAEDTDGDGIVDVYYRETSAKDLVHATDLNGNGDWWDPNEAWLQNISGAGGETGMMQELELIQVGPADATYLGGHWVLASWKNDLDTKWRYVDVHDLDKDGDILVNSVKRIITYKPGVSGDASLVMGNNVDQMRFAPLGVPEPTTMLLVGTGILGLAGVVRRRLLG